MYKYKFTIYIIICFEIQNYGNFSENSNKNFHRLNENKYVRNNFLGNDNSTKLDQGCLYRDSHILLKPIN